MSFIATNTLPLLDATPSFSWASGEAAAMGCAVLWAFSAYFFASAGRRIGSQQVNRIRLVMASLLLGLTMLATGGDWHIESAQFWLMAISGVVGLVIGDAGYFQALVMLGARRATLCMALGPAITALFMIPLLGESIGPLGVLGMAITLAGVMWVVLERGAPGETRGKLAAGIAFAVVGVVGQAIGFVIAKVGIGAAPADSALASLAGLPTRVSEHGVALAGTHVDALYGTFIRMVAATVAIYVWSALRGRMSDTLLAVRDTRAVKECFAGAVVGPFIGVWLSLVALSLANTAVATTIMSTYPVFVIPIMAVAERRRVSWRGILGALVAMAGVALLTLRGELGA